MEPSPAAARLLARANNPLLMGLAMLVKLPAALFAGVRIRRATLERAEVVAPYGWRSQNPFRSTYFAVQAMAAEMSTGVLVLLAVEQSGVPCSTLIVDLQATFGKKAAGDAVFTCEGGAAALAAVAEAVASGSPRTVTLESVGRLADGAEVSRFRFTWSVKARTAR